MAEEEDPRAVETVDDNDDDDDDVVETTTTNTTVEAAAMEATRAQAEARRERILEKANSRMKYVNGEQIQDSEEKKTSLSNAARIRAARQRRYGKKSATAAAATPSAATETETKSTESTNEATPDGASAEPESKVEESSKESAVVETENTTSASTIETNTSESETKKEESDDKEKSLVNESVVEKQSAEGTTNTTAAPAASEETSGDEGTEPAASGAKKKKYVGVARMRRKMLAKKKMEGSSTDSATATASIATGRKTAKGATTTTTAATTFVGIAAALPPVKVQTIPIYMHMIVILLLFVAGFDVGIQQFHADVDVRTQVAVQEYGMPFVHRNPWNPLTPMIAAEKDTMQTLEEKLSSSSSGGGLQDEFQEIDQEYVPPNIDPIFKMDLDELTKGPGFIKQMARGAIAIHRLTLWFIYYVPMGFFSSIISIPTALIQTPPGLFLIAIFLRQFVGKIVLGATIPEASGGDSGDGKKQNNIEVLSMAKNFVKNFFVTSFPKVVTLYDAYLHLKSDMYIVLCGVFFGLAWTHLNNSEATCGAADPIMSGGGDAHGGEL